MGQKLSSERTSHAYHAQRVGELARSIQHHRDVYYKGVPEISDAAFDQLEEELRRLAPNHPVLQSVGSEIEPTGGGSKIKHDRPMLSLNKTYHIEDLKTWINGHAIVGMLKVDGNSLSVVYEQGQMQVAKTRGNGQFGEDVTNKIQWVPDVVPFLKKTGRVEIRGELYCTETQFVKLSDRMAMLGLERPTSPRNIVAGLLGRKTHIDLMSYICFFAFDVIDYDEQLNFKTEVEKFAWLEAQGFSVPRPKLLENFDGVTQYLEQVKQVMAEDEVGIDGAVFSLNDIAKHHELGNTSHHPRFKISFKWQGQTAISTIQSIVWATSRLGIVTPVAIIEPVQLSGATITNITLHNAAHVRAYNLKPGDSIELVRSGEVIPKYLGTVESHEGQYNWPSDCPACGTTLVHDDVRLKCPNKAHCPAQQSGSILNWIRSVEIDDLSEKRLQALIDAGLVRSICDLYRLQKEDFLKIPQTKDKLANKLYQNIQKSRDLPLQRFLNGLGIEGSGLTTWEKLLENFPSLPKVQEATVEQIAAIDGFAERSALQIVQGLQENEGLIQDLLASGVKPHYVDVQEFGSGRLEGKTFVITGALSRPREDYVNLIKKEGGKVSSSVSKHTDAVVTDDPQSTSSKMQKARSLGVKIWNEKDLLDALGLE